MVATDWGAGVDLLARRPSHIPDRLQESAGGAHQLGVRVSRSTPPAANYHAPAGRRSKRPRVGGSRESRARFGSTKCAMTAQVAASVVRVLLAACLLSLLGTVAPCWGQSLPSNAQPPPPLLQDCQEVNARRFSRPQFLLDRSEEDWSALCNRTLRIDPWDPVKYVRIGEGHSFLSFGGELRSAFEMYDNYNWGAGPQDGNGYSLNRLMGHVDAHIGKHVRAFAEVQSGLPFGRDGGPRPVVDRDELDVSQLFLELRLSVQTTRLTIRA